ncbi:2-oxoacid:acceptor oxidoreductase subunit alpha [Wukongibacter baidiensis]|uniref:2-oxoacid:acceptor oxidoreductase subunit alpha n=1 Tax=Wukongibacter baidiensis TaxID=1723361 RepID=UPI003D7F478F
MANNVNLMITGIQGDGTASIGNTLIRALSRLGYYTYGFRNFSSRIKGGHTNYVIEISTKKVLACSDKLDMLVASDMESLEINIDKVKNGGLLIHDSSIDPKGYFSRRDLHILSLPFIDIAKEHGSFIMKNTSLIGFLGRLLNIPMKSLDEVLRETFLKKGENIVLQNLFILEKSYNFPIDIKSFIKKYGLESVAIKKRPTMLGNEAIALGALMGGCRLMTAYPITPASEIMEYLSKNIEKYDGLLVQTEDEIAAVTMAIGGAYGGVRSMTATSGPGIALMMEGISLAGMAEIPIVIVDSQRTGPSTGLPTKHEQSDIQLLYYGPHGEIPLIIVTPYSVEECFYQTINAFNLAEKYQCPVIVLSDLSLGLSRQTIDDLDKSKITIDRGKIADDKNLSTATKDFRRYDFSEDNISLRSFPGMKNGIHKVTGLEHSVIGVPNSTPGNRKRMMDKRLGKIRDLENEDNIDLFGDSNNELLVLSIGSNYGIIKKAVEDFNLPVTYGVFKMIKPLPIKQLQALLEKYSKILIIENNATGQLISIIRQKMGYGEKLHSLIKYDGTPFMIEEIKDKVEELI